MFIQYIFGLCQHRLSIADHAIICSLRNDREIKSYSTAVAKLHLCKQRPFIGIDSNRNASDNVRYLNWCVVFAEGI
jgi:hypothetical protein